MFSYWLLFTSLCYVILGAFIFFLIVLMLAVIYTLFTSSDPKAFVRSSIFLQACLLDFVGVLLFVTYILTASSANYEYSKHRWGESLWNKYKTVTPVIFILTIQLHSQWTNNRQHDACGGGAHETLFFCLLESQSEESTQYTTSASSSAWVCLSRWTSGIKS